MGARRQRLTPAPIVLAVLHGCHGSGPAGAHDESGSAELTVSEGGSPSTYAQDVGGEPEDDDTTARRTTTTEDTVGTADRDGAASGADDEDSGAGLRPPPGEPFIELPIDAPHAMISGAFGPGTAWADVDRDADLDLFVVGGMLPSRVLWNAGDGTLVAVDDPTSPLATALATSGAVFGDYDNDGWPDLYVLRNGPNLLLHNEGGTFTDVSASSGAAGQVYSISASWGDYDADGLLDLYVCNVDFQADVLLHNEGDGVFSDVSPLLQPGVAYQTFASAWLDYDDDADLDLYVVNDLDVGNALWRSDGPGCGGWCFVDVAAATGAIVPAEGMGIAVGDYDGDNDLDLSYSDKHWHLLLRSELSDGLDAFTDVSVASGVAYDAAGWGTVFFDYDNDGWLDLYVADAGGPDRLFENRGDGTFADVSSSCGCADPGFGFGVSYADYDGDGAVDFVVSNRGDGHHLYRNRAIHPDRHWLTIELVGGGPVNRDAIGSRVWVTTSAGRVLMQEVKSGSSVASQNMLRLHFGLDSETIDEILIRWPNGAFEKPLVPPLDELWTHAYAG